MTSERSRGDRRQFGRRWCILHAYLKTEGGRRIDCIVANISERGAFIEGDLPFLPDGCRLVIDAIGINVECEIKRQVEGGAGLFFREWIDLPVHMPRRMIPLRPGTTGPRTSTMAGAF